MGKGLVVESLPVNPDLILEAFRFGIWIAHQGFAQEEERDQTIEYQCGCRTDKADVVIAGECNPPKDGPKRHADIACHAENAVALYAISRREHIRQDGIRAKPVKRVEQARGKHQERKVPVGTGVNVAKIRHCRSKQPDRHDALAPEAVHQRACQN